MVFTLSDWMAGLWRVADAARGRRAAIDGRVSARRHRLGGRAL